MTALAINPEPETVTRDTGGSNVVDHYPNGRSVIRDVALFSENAKHSELGDADREMLSRIVEKTNAMAEAGRHTQIVIRHARPDGPVDHASYGSARDLRVQDIGGTAYIVGDLHMAAYTTHMLASYPRRSAEIFMLDGTPEGDLWMGNLALLGRELPGADIPDVSLNSGSAPMVEFETDVPEVTFAQEPQMKKEDVTKFLKDMDDKDRSDYLKQFSSDDKPADDDKKGDEPKKSDNSADVKPADPTPQPQAASFADSPEKLAQDVRIGKLEETIRGHEVERKLAGLADKGVEFDAEAEAARLTAIIDPEARAAEFTRMEKNYKRTDTPRSLISASNTAAEFAANASDGTPVTVTQKQVAQITNKAAEFRSSNPAMSFEEAKFKAAEHYGLGDAMKAIAGA